MPPPNSQRGSATADEIRQVALEQFAQAGFDATSMREIAGTVGIQAASLYNHFGSKEAMLWDLTLSALDELTIGRETAMAILDPGASPVERLGRFVTAHIAFHARHRDQAVLVNSQLGSLSEEHYREAVARRHGYESHLRLIIDDGVRTGDFDPPDVRVSAFAILQMGMAVSSWFRPDGPHTIEELCEIYADLATRMLAPRPLGTA